MYIKHVQFFVCQLYLSVGTLTRVGRMVKAHVPYTRAEATTQQCSVCTVQVQLDAV